MKRITRAQKQQWVDDLYSGKFRQGRSRLVEQRMGGEKYYCCLGVLATQLEGGSPSPYFLCERVGELANDNSLLLTAGEQTYLANMNDQGVSFDYIADTIQKMIHTQEDMEEMLGLVKS